MTLAATLFEQATSFSALVAAARQAVRGKKNRPEVRRLLFDLEPRLIRLSDALQSGAWKPGPYRTFTVCEPKQRLIAAAPLDDRVVHHGVCAVIEPILERHSIHHSYACRKGKGTHRAVRRTQRLARRYRYFLKADVRKFFDSVDHGILEAMLQRIVDDERLLGLLGQIIDHGPPGRPAGKGLPIGNLTSQHFANLYLAPLDRALCGRFGEGRYLRYMDDFLLFGDSKEELHRARAEAGDALASLGLQLKDAATLIAPVTEGAPFLGMRIFPQTVRLQHAGRSRFFRNRKKRLADVLNGHLDQQRFQDSEQSVFAHLAHTDTYRLRRCALSVEG